MPIIKNCKRCKTEIKVKPSQTERKNFCSKSCAYAYKSENPEEYSNPKGKEIPCGKCGKLVYRYPRDVKKHEGKAFCSKECFDDSRRGVEFVKIQKRVDLKCEVCEKDFKLPLHIAKDRRFCSTRCRNIFINKQKIKRTEVECSWCNEKITKIKSLAEKRKYHFCNKECMALYYANTDDFRGENSPNWTGGDIGYYGPNWRKQRRKARERDKYTCQDCGITEKEYGQELSVHHKKPFRAFEGDWKKANRLSNLASVCEPCHRKRHSGNGHHTKYKIKYKEKINT